MKRLWFSVLALLGTVPAFAQETQKTPPDQAVQDVVVVRRVEFEADLRTMADVDLEGLAPVHNLHFTLPRTWTLTEDPEVTLHLDHSGVLDPSRSMLTVSVNGSALHTVRLVAENATDARITFRIPRHVLEDHNTLELRVNQHLDEECEDPFDPALWTRARKDSFIQFWYRRNPVVPELLAFPFPIIDDLGYGPVELALAGEGALSAAAVQVLGDVGFALGREASWRGLSLMPPVTDPADARGNLLVVGTPAANPLVGRLLGDVPVAPGRGLVALLPNPSDPSLAILVVAGGDEAGLSLAGRALAGQHRYRALSGASSEVLSVEAGEAWPTRQDPVPAPPADSFTLADLGYEDTTVRGYYSSPVHLPLRLEGDAHPRKGMARFGVDYAYSPQIDPRLTTVEVMLNGVSLRGEALQEIAGEEKKRLWVHLPEDLLVPSSDLQVVFHLFPRDFDPCVHVSDRQIWATLFSSSTLEVPRDHYAWLPALDLLRYDLWPLDRALGSEGVVVVTGDTPGLDDGAAVLALSAELARKSTSRSSRLVVQPSTADVFTRHDGAQVVLLVGPGSHGAWQSLVESRRLTAVGDQLRLLAVPGQDLLKARVGTPYGTIEQAIHPKNDQRTVLALRSLEAGHLVDVVEALADPARVSAMDGNAVVLAGDREVRALDLVSRSLVGNLGVEGGFRVFLKRYWMVLAIGLLASAMILGTIIRRWALGRGGQT